MADNVVRPSKDFPPLSGRTDPAGIYAPGKKSEWKEHHGVSYFTHIHRK